MELIISSYGGQLDGINNIIRSSKREIVLFSPYCKVEAIDKLELPESCSIIIVTTLRLKDLLSGSSDINLYPYAKNKNIKVFFNNRIHLKAFLSDWDRLVFGSSNLTGKGLGYDDVYNLELNGISCSINVDTKSYFRKIISDSVLLDDSSYNYVKEMFDKSDFKDDFVEFDFTKLRSEITKEFLISSLPMTKDINRLYYLITTYFDSVDSVEVDCAIHDQVLYNLPFDATFEEFIDILRVNFFKSRFIQSLLVYIDEEERYFGAVKQWIQNNCSNVPVPSRRDLTGNIQVLYKWIEFLSDGKYIVDRPNYSERIRRVKA